MIISADNQSEVNKAKEIFLTEAEKTYRDYHLQLAQKIERIADLFDEYNRSIGL